MSGSPDRRPGHQEPLIQETTHLARTKSHPLFREMSNSHDVRLIARGLVLTVLLASIVTVGVTRSN